MLFLSPVKRVDFNCALAFIIIIPVIITNGLCPLAFRIVLEKCAGVTPHLSA